MSTEPVEFNEDVEWKPQDSRTATTLNDVYCVKTKSAGVFVSTDQVRCCCPALLCTFALRVSHLGVLPALVGDT